MMNTYLRTMEFVIDGKVAREESFEILVDDSEVQKNICIDGEGTTFDSLWNYMGTAYKGLNVPANRWTKAFWSNKRRIEFFTKTKTWVDDGTERVWAVRYYDEPYQMSMERVLKFKSDKVVKYLQERNLTVGVDK